MNNWVQMIKSYLKNSLRIHEENTKENHNCVMSLYIIKTYVTISWISLQIFLNIFSLRKQKLPNLSKQLAYKTFCLLSRSKNSQYVLYQTQNTRLLPHVLYPIKHSCLFFKHYIKIYFKNSLRSVKTININFFLESQAWLVKVGQLQYKLKLHSTWFVTININLFEFN